MTTRTTDTTSVNPEFEAFVAQSNAFLSHTEDVLRDMNADMEQLGDITTGETAPEQSTSQYAADTLLRYGVDTLFQSNLLLLGL